MELAEDAHHHREDVHLFHLDPPHWVRSSPPIIIFIFFKNNIFFFFFFLKYIVQASYNITFAEVPEHRVDSEHCTLHSCFMLNSKHSFFSLYRNL